MATKAADDTFEVVFKDFHVGQAPLAYLDSKTEYGQSGHAASASFIDVISEPGKLRQGPGIGSDFTNWSTLNPFIGFIYDGIIGNDASFRNYTLAIADGKLYQIDAGNTVTNTGIWPHSFTAAGSNTGLSGTLFNGSFYYFHSTDCGKYDLATTFDDTYFSATVTGATALQSAPHPVAVQQDLMLFGNGRYVGVFNSTTTTLVANKLDFGSDAQVADIVFNNNQWVIAVNYGLVNLQHAVIYFYDASATTSQLADQIDLGNTQIGFLQVVNGIVYVTYRTLTYSSTTTSNPSTLGYIKGRQIEPLQHFNSQLPTFTMKAFYREMILFATNLQVGVTKTAFIYSAGAAAPSFPFQFSPISGTTTSNPSIQAIANPFGVPIVAYICSTGSTNHLAAFSGLHTDAVWRSIVVPVIKTLKKGFIDTVTVLTETLSSDAGCTVAILADQLTKTGTTLSISGSASKRCFIFKQVGLTAIEDFAALVSWSTGSSSNNCTIRKIIVSGHFVETTS